MSCSWLSTLKYLWLLAFVLAQTGHACNCEIEEYSSAGCCSESSSSPHSQSSDNHDCCNSCFLEKDSYALVASEIVSSERIVHSELTKYLAATFESNGLENYRVAIDFSRRDSSRPFWRSASIPRAPPVYTL